MKAGHDDLLSHVRALLAAHDWAGADAAAAPALNGPSPSVALLLAAHRARIGLGDLDAARRLVERALAIDPHSSPALNARGALALRERRYADARDDCAAAAAQAPAVAYYHACHADACLRLGDYEPAFDSAERALALDPSPQRWWLSLGTAAGKLGRYRRATEALGQVLARGGDNPATRAAWEEASRKAAAAERGEAVGHEASATYYDRIYASLPAYRAPASESLYLPLWRRVVALLGPAPRVLDLGCGPGQFAEFFAEQRPQGAYCGIDFSAEAVAQARRRCPSFRFEEAALPAPAIVASIAHDTIVCTEVLEHIDDDLGLLASLPAGVRLIASVPNYDSFGHVRIFASESDVRDRYGPFVDGLEVEPFMLNGTSTIWLLHGRTRTA